MIPWREGKDHLKRLTSPSTPYLNYFSIGNRVWPKMEIESLKPLIHSQITYFGWWGAKILDNDYLCLADSRIKKLDMFIAQTMRLFCAQKEEHERQ